MAAAKRAAAARPPDGAPGPPDGAPEAAPAAAPVAATAGALGPDPEHAALAAKIEELESSLAGLRNELDDINGGDGRPS